VADRTLPGDSGSGATMATVNLAHVVAAVEFIAEVTVEPPRDAAVPIGDEIVAGVADDAPAFEAVGRSTK
jgi:hypothetical protein